MNLHTGMRTILFTCFVWTAAFTLPNGSLEAARLHAIVVADTTDESIGESTMKDLENIQKELQRIASYTGLELKEVTLSGKAVRPNKLFEKLDKLKVRKDDAVFFYYSGHGYRTTSKEGNPWPNLYFSTEHLGVEYDYIVEQLTEKNPRLLIAVADACNSWIPDDYAPVLVRKFALRKEDEAVARENYRALFLGVNGVVMVTSSTAGEPSWGTATGGFFTNALLRSIGSEVNSSEQPANWQTVLDRAALQVYSYQHPDYRLWLN